MAKLRGVGTYTGGFVGSPAYRRIEEDIRTQIRIGRWRLGAPIPSRRELARQYGVQLPTVQRAVAALLSDGTLVAKPRQGTVVGKVDTDGRIEQLVTSPSPRDPMPIWDMNVGIMAMISFDDDRRSNGRNFNEGLVDSLELALGMSEVSSTFFSRGHYPNDESGIQAMLESGCDALVLVLTLESVETVERCLKLITPLSMPVVFVTAYPIGAPYSTVCYDQESAGYRAAQHLVNANAERVVFFAPFKAKWLDERIIGATSAVTRAGLSLDVFSIYPEVHELDPWKTDYIQLARDAALRGMNSGDLTNCGIIACNDNSAIALMEAARELGLESGVDYQLVSFDDIPDARKFGISSLRPPATAMGDEAAKLMLRHLRGDSSVLQVSLQSHLVTRSSSRSVAALRDHARSHLITA